MVTVTIDGEVTAILLDLDSGSDVSAIPSLRRAQARLKASGRGRAR
ncbi:hypothetical protein ACYOEI_26420 [Singulisphaera rosea]